jgi:transcriptional regulator with GAF, ATPase, and Fis domain
MVSNMNDMPLSAEETPQGRTPQGELAPAGPSSGESDYARVGKILTLRSRIADAETEAILSALENTDWNRKRAARLLAISYRGLLYKIRRHNIVRTK